MPSWPASLPDFALRAGYAEGFPDNVLRSQMDIGRPKKRRRFSGTTYPLKVTMELSSSQLDDFIDFLRDDIGDGALSFTYTHPRTGATVTAELAEHPKPVPAAGANSYILEMSLLVTP